MASRLPFSPPLVPIPTLPKGPGVAASLTKYKVEKNLDENKNRPGVVRDEDNLLVSDHTDNLMRKENSSDLKTEIPTVNEFKDARFYTEYHFLKLANQLKEKTLPSGLVKPINIVEPIVNSNDQQTVVLCAETSSNNNEAHSPISSSLWKLQREQYEDRVRYLEEQIKGLYEQLEMQTQVNAELKKLLVASIGDDIQYKIERLVNDKQRFEYELTLNSQRLAKISEELEQISIQCDLWRTKFLASKALNEELLTWKTFLLLLQQEHNHLIRNILTENEENNQKLNEIYINLVCLNKTQNDVSKQVFYPKHNVKLVSHIDMIVSGMVEKRGNIPAIQMSTCDDILIKSTTKNEYLAKQMLTQFAWLPYSNANTFELIESLLNGLKIQKTKFVQRYDQFNDDVVNLKCCSKCKGTIQVV
jgi:hypothetical protein